MHNYKELKVWRSAMDLATAIYKMTANFPNEEKYGLTSQMRRCCVSIASNIAEGAGRGSNTQFRYFLLISLGSSFELETQLMLSCDLCIFDQTVLKDLSDKTSGIQRMLYMLHKKLPDDKPNTI